VVLTKLWLFATNKGKDGRTSFGENKGSSNEYRKRELHVASNQFIHQQFVELVSYKGQFVISECLTRERV